MKPFIFIASLMIALVLFIQDCGIQQEENIPLQMVTGEDFQAMQAFYVPDTIATIDLGLSIDIQDNQALNDLGLLAVAKRTSVSGVACLDCHSPDASFYSLVRKPSGGGHYNGIHNVMYYNTFGKESFKPVDVKPVSSPTLANTHRRKNGLHSAGLGTEGLNKNVADSLKTAFLKGNNSNALESQFAAGNVAHFMDGLALELMNDDLAQELSMKAVGKPIDFQILQCAVASWEANVLTNQNNVNKVIRGESKGLHSKEGMYLFKKHCYSCHMQDTLAMKLGESDFAGRFLLTKDSADIGLVYSPSIEQIKDKSGKHHNEEVGGYRSALNDHDGVHINKDSIEITPKEKTAILRFVNKDLFDPNLKRYATRTRNKDSQGN